MKGTRFAVIAVVSSVLLAALLMFFYTKGASPSSAARLQASAEKPRQEKSSPASYGRFQAPVVIAPSSL